VSIDVTVVVPVWNPGRVIDRCIASLLGQSWPADRLELLFVDDGATDATPDRLDAMAGDHPQVRVIHQANSGWPGKPRNVGTDAARGDYVFYVDQDDCLGPDTIERMLELGRPNGADVILGKVVSNFRGVPHKVFAATRGRCTLRDAPLIDSLTPHKMFRRSFLADNGIRFPEGRRRLEDQLFMVRSYFAAGVVSIVGDYPCYFYLRRPDYQNAGSAQIDPVGYYDNLREVLAVIIQNTPSGEFRNHLLRRFYRVEMLGRLSEPKLLDYDEPFRRRVFDEVRRLARELPPPVANGLPGVDRARAQLVEHDDLPALVGLAAACSTVKAASTLRDLTRSGLTWSLEVQTELVSGEDRQPLRVAVTPSLDQMLMTATEPGLAVSVSQEDLDAAEAEVVLSDRDGHTEWPAPHTLRASVAREKDGGRLTFSGSATLDVSRLAGGAALPRGSWDVWVRIRAFGLVKRVRVGAVRRVLPPSDALGPVVTSSGLLVLAYFTDQYGNLSFDIGERRKPFSLVLRDRPVLVSRPAGPTIELRVPVPLVGPAGAGPSWTLMFGNGHRVVACGRLDLAQADDGTTVARVRLPELRRSRDRGRWLALCTHPAAPPTVIGGWSTTRGGIVVATADADRDRAGNARESARERADRRRLRRRRLRRLFKRPRLTLPARSPRS